MGGFGIVAPLLLNGGCSRSFSLLTAVFLGGSIGPGVDWGGSAWLGWIGRWTLCFI